MCHVGTYLDAHGNIPLLVVGGGLEFVGFVWNPEKKIVYCLIGCKKGMG